MSSIVACPSCGQKNRIPAEGDGKKIVCGRCKTLVQVTGGPIEAKDANFDQLIGNEQPTIVDFWAAWCGPCRTIAPVIEDLAATRTDVRFAKLNVDENPGASARYRVSGIPTLIFFRGGAELGRVVGAVGRREIEQAIDRYFAR